MTYLIKIRKRESKKGEEENRRVLEARWAPVSQPAYNYNIFLRNTIIRATSAFKNCEWIPANFTSFIMHVVSKLRLALF